MRRFLLMAALLGTCAFSGARAADSPSAKESYVQKSEAEVREWTAKLKSLQERSQKSGEQTRYELDKQLRAIDAQLAIARNKLDAMHKSSEGSWDHFRQGLDETMHDVKRDYRKAVSFFNKSETKEKS